MDGFGEIVYECLKNTELPDSAIATDGSATENQPRLPGYFRPSKSWDITVVQNQKLVAAVEFKSQTSSYGNNWNNRIEEAVGNAVDVYTAIEQDIISQSFDPWLGYFTLIGGSSRDAGSNATIPQIAQEYRFPDLSYASRYEMFCRGVMEQDIYDSASVIMANDTDGKEGRFESPSGLGFDGLVSSLSEHVSEYLQDQGTRQKGLSDFSL